MEEGVKRKKTQKGRNKIPYMTRMKTQRRIERLKKKQER